jgi:2,3,4,5-tetrahydropyridine-2-carboxylate N-succinyltransferase
MKDVSQRSNVELRERILELAERARTEQRFGPEYFEAFAQLKAGLNAGTIRAAEPRAGTWVVNPWVKQGILLGFRIGALVDYSIDERFRFFDKETYPLRRFVLEDRVRIVPGGSSVRDGCYVAPGVVCMPPMFINVGAYVDEGTMVDSHALVGSCAQIGKRVHLSAGCMIGGVLEPAGALPVIVEDEALVGGNTGLYEGVIVRRRAVIAAGTIITGGTPVYDLVRDAVYTRTEDRPLEIPEGAVVVPGARAITRGRGWELGLGLATPIIVKYRDEKTDLSVRLEELLR